VNTSLGDGLPYRLYTSDEAAARVGTDLTASLFNDLARSGTVRCTRIGRKIRWTDEQLAAVVAAHEVPASGAARDSAPLLREAQPALPVELRGTVAPLVSKPGRRYMKETA
jgi:hypothetical protein